MLLNSFHVIKFIFKRKFQYHEQIDKFLKIIITLYHVNNDSVINTDDE